MDGYIILLSKIHSYRNSYILIYLHVYNSNK